MDFIKIINYNIIYCGTNNPEDGEPHNICVLQETNFKWLNIVNNMESVYKTNIETAINGTNKWDWVRLK